MKQTLKIGDKVKVKETSKYFKQQGNHGIGEIINIDRFSDDKWFSVKFSDKYENAYTNKDIKLIPNISKQPRQFKLLKDTPECKKGTIFTYSIDYNYEPECGYYTKDKKYFYSVDDVETQPKWFQEIFEEKHNPKILDIKIYYPKNKPKESKEIKKLDYPILNEPLPKEITNWMKQITDTVNSLKGKQ